MIFKDFYSNSCGNIFWFSIFCLSFVKIGIFLLIPLINFNRSIYIFENLLNINEKKGFIFIIFRETK